MGFRPRPQRFGMVAYVFGEVADRPMISSGVGICDRVRAVFLGCFGARA